MGALTGSRCAGSTTTRYRGTARGCSWTGIWPRGLTKAQAELSEWCKQVAPSTALRTWYGHDPERFEEFARRYREELTEPDRAEALAHLRELAAGGTLTLLTATRDPGISAAAVLRGLLG